MNTTNDSFRLSSSKTRRVNVADSGEQLGKLPPQRVDIEETILGALVLERPAWDIVKNILTPESFYRDAHKLIFEAIQQMAEDGIPIDIKTTVHQLRRNGTLEVVGGAYYIAELTTRVNSAANIEAHARIVTEQHIKRKLIEISSRLNHDAYEDTEDVFQMLTDLKSQLAELDESTVKTIKNQNALVVMDREDLLDEFTTGQATGENSQVPQMTGDDGEPRFSWKRGFSNCWTGNPNDGKTTFFNQMALTKAVKDNWKFCLFTPEMVSSRRREGIVKINAHDIINELIHSLTGKVPYKHWKNGEKLTADEYMEAAEKINQWFKVINPHDRDYKNIIDVFMYYYEKYGFDAFLVDPFKNVRYDLNTRTDLMLDRIFDDFGQLAIDTDAVMNFIAHPKSQEDVRNSDGTFKIIYPHMLLGGSSWWNNMDAIYSIYRPNKHIDSFDPWVEFYNLKQRKQQLVARVGKIDSIKFEYYENRYYFSGVCPIDGRESTDMKFKPQQETIDWTQSKKANDEVNDLPF